MAHDVDPTAESVSNAIRQADQLFTAAIPLSMATLCLDCEMVSARLGSCPKCGHHQLVRLSRWLNRLEESSHG
jgi:hypothetical protein